MPHHKPAGYVLWGVWYEASYFKDILVGVAEQVHFHRRERFAEVLTDQKFRGSSRVYFADSSINSHKVSEAISDSGYFVETNFESARTIRLARTLLTHFGYREGDLRVMVETLPPQDPSQTPSA